jgi:hypothetical protein
MDLVIGVDLSPTGLALVAMPLDWDLRFERCPAAVYGYSLPRSAPASAHVLRLRAIVADACAFVHARSGGARHVFLEGYPIMGGRGVYNLHLVCEVGGALRMALAERLGIVARTAPLSTARRLVIGPHRSAGAKALIQKAVREIGAPASWSEHEVDAWVAANYGASELGGCAIAIGAAA